MGLDTCELNSSSSSTTSDSLVFNNESELFASSSLNMKLRRRSFTSERRRAIPPSSRIHKRHSIHTISGVNIQQQYPTLKSDVDNDSNTTGSILAIPLIFDATHHQRRRSSTVHSFVESDNRCQQNERYLFSRPEEASNDQVFRHNSRDRQVFNNGDMPTNSDNLSPTVEEQQDYFERLHLPRTHLYASRRSTLYTMSSRPPSYKPYATSERNIQREQERIALVRLQQLYQRERQIRGGSGWLQHILFNRSSEEEEELSQDRVKWNNIFTACIYQQFEGFNMAFWIILLVFIGAISVFVPGLSGAAFTLWIPLVLYGLLNIFILRHRRKQKEQIQMLEYQIAEDRERRIRELMEHVELPENHYFVTDFSRQDHTHPVTTLLPPPPTYQHNDHSITINGTSALSSSSSSSPLFSPSPLQSTMARSIASSEEDHGQREEERWRRYNVEEIINTEEQH
ncbi:hypothetical protein INT45_007479 [Circinella minor]|uniref:Uncharacterized protein n=1 Tax=Circinella minor TaxID=1195481 RepID=A0A8H7VUD9_9FUNG|nr:hypothetical protein INT45_007479 [Circinella minor]